MTSKQQPNDDSWSVIYDTPVKRLLFRCGLRYGNEPDSYFEKSTWRVSAKYYHHKPPPTTNGEIK